MKSIQHFLAGVVILVVATSVTIAAGHALGAFSLNTAKAEERPTPDVGNERVNALEHDADLHDIPGVGSKHVSAIGDNAANVTRNEVQDINAAVGCTRESYPTLRIHFVCSRDQHPLKNVIVERTATEALPAGKPIKSGNRNFLDVPREWGEYRIRSIEGESVDQVLQIKECMPAEITLSCGETVTQLAYGS